MVLERTEILRVLMKEENNVSRNYYATVVWYWREQKSCPFSTLFTVTRALMKKQKFHEFTTSDNNVSRNYYEWYLCGEQKTNPSSVHPC